MSEIQPGDLLYYNGIGHVAMYVGGGMIIDAPQPGQPVRELPMCDLLVRGQPRRRRRSRSRALPTLSTLAGTMRRTLIVTNDFPPRQGGIQSFVHELALRLDPGGPDRLRPEVGRRAGVRRQPAVRGGPAPDVADDRRPQRHPPRRRARPVERQAEVVIFGAAAPLGLITPALRRAGVRQAIAITHGHEAGWAALPVARSLLRRIGERTDVVTYLGEYFRVRLAAGAHARRPPRG